MPDFSRLSLPQSLTYCKNSQMARQMLQRLLQKAIQGVQTDYVQEFDYLCLNLDGLKRCADFWVFAVRFFVIKHDLKSATTMMLQALESGAQPHQLILQTQQSLNSLLKKVQERENMKQSITVQQELGQLPSSAFFHNSQTLMQKQAIAVKWSEQQKQLYQRELQRITAPQIQNMLKTPSLLMNLSTRDAK